MYYIVLNTVFGVAVPQRFRASHDLFAVRGALRADAGGDHPDAVHRHAGRAAGALLGLHHRRWILRHSIHHFCNKFNIYAVEMERFLLYNNFAGWNEGGDFERRPAGCGAFPLHPGYLVQGIDATSRWHRWRLQNCF